MTTGEADTATELIRLRASLRRLWLVAGLALAAALIFGGLLVAERLGAPERVEIREGSRAAVLTAERLEFRFDGEPRVVLDVHSGLVVRTRDSRVSIDPLGRIQVHRGDELVLWADPEAGWAAEGAPK